MQRNLQLGAALVEYALALGLLVAIFVIVGINLEEGARSRSSQSRSVETNGGAPCRADGLGQWGADACK